MCAGIPAQKCKALECRHIIRHYIRDRTEQLGRETTDVSEGVRGDGVRGVGGIVCMCTYVHMAKPCDVTLHAFTLDRSFTEIILYIIYSRKTYYN